MASVDDPVNSAPDRELEDPGKARVFYDERYRAGYMDDWPIEKRDRVAALVKELRLAPRGRALDYGCGVGAFTAVLRSALPGWEVHGTDISNEALARAEAALPDCHFHKLDECERLGGSFDFIFSHHVLEHVSDVQSTAATIANMLVPGGAMLHILPCRDPGGLEAWVCALRRDGIEPDRGNRFFFDEEGHLRRLSSQDLIGLWSGHGFSGERVYHAARCWGAIERLSGSEDLGELWRFSDPSKAVDRRAARRLHVLRVALVALWFARRPTTIVRHKAILGVHGARDVRVLSAACILYPISWPIDWLTRSLVRREWTRHRGRPEGSEMYVFLTRRTPGPTSE